MDVLDSGTDANNGVAFYTQNSPSDPAFRTDYSTGFVNNRGDLQDFARMAIQLPPKFAATDNTWSATITLTALDGSPRIKLFSIDQHFAFTYLTDPLAQNPQEFHRNICELYQGGPTYTLSAQDLEGMADWEQSDFLIEAGSAGKCVLTVSFSRGGIVEATDHAYFDFKPADQMYDTNN